MMNTDQRAESFEQTTVLAGPSREVSLAACAHEIMNRAGLRSLHDTYAAIRAGTSASAISVSVNPASNEIQISDLASGTQGWVVVEQFGNGTPARGLLFNELPQAAAYFGTKLTLQESGAVTMRRDSSLGMLAAHYVGSGNSRITGLTLSKL